MNYNSYPSIGVDTKIKIIQDVMSGHLGFDNVDYYGRALKVVSKDGKSFVPEVHISNLERKEVYYDDQKAPGGNVFFIEADEEHTAKVGGMFTAKIKIVFMLNLNKLTGYGPDKTYRADSEVQDHCYKLVKRIGALDITGVEKGLSNVLKGFDLTNIVKNDLQPYHTFSINGNINYTFNCNH